MEQYLVNYNRWLNSDRLSDAERAELLSIKDDDNEIRLRFTDYLSFGTAGLRGTMKVGMNAMNVHTVAYATQALADLITAEGRTADEQAAFEHTRTLVRYRTSEPVVQSGKLTQFYRTDNLYVFARHNEEKVVVTITNFSPDGRTVTWSDYAELLPEGAKGRSILTGGEVVAEGEMTVEGYYCDVVEFVK